MKHLLYIGAFFFHSCSDNAVSANNSKTDSLQAVNDSLQKELYKARGHTVNATPDKTSQGKVTSFSQPTPSKLSLLNKIVAILKDNLSSHDESLDFGPDKPMELQSVYEPLNIDVFEDGGEYFLFYKCRMLRAATKTTPLMSIDITYFIPMDKDKTELRTTNQGRIGFKYFGIRKINNTVLKEEYILMEFATTLNQEKYDQVINYFHQLGL